jgi:hypothetical protein
MTVDYLPRLGEVIEVFDVDDEDIEDVAAKAGKDPEEYKHVGFFESKSKSTITEATGDTAAKKAASKKFWSAAKYGNRMEEEAFHTAFDDELKELGMMDMFDERGILADDYGRIKKAKEANPDSWALKALGTLWALRYKDLIYFKAEEEDQAKRHAEYERQEAEERAEKERKATEQRELLTQELKALVPDALKKVDQEALKNYKDAFNVTDADFDVEVASSNYVKVYPAKSGYTFGRNSKLDTLTDIVNIIK